MASNCPWLQDLTIDMPGGEVRVLFPTYVESKKRIQADYYVALASH